MRLVLTAGVHGDEFEGIWALGELAQERSSQDLYGPFRAGAPISDPELLAAVSHTSPADGGNLNGSLPAVPAGRQPAVGPTCAEAR